MTPRLLARRRPPPRRLAARTARAVVRAALAGLGALGAGAGLAVPLDGPVAAAAPRRRPDRVVVVVLGGGVRTKELLGRPDLLPTVAAIGKAGVRVDGVAVGGDDPASATEALLTGRDAAPAAGPGPRRPSHPTLLEYARAAGRPASDVWYASYADGDALALATSLHPDFGAAFAPSLAVGDGPFGEPLAALFRRFGRPNPTTSRTWALLDAARDATAAAAARAGTRGPGAAAAAEERRVEQALLEEVDRRARDLAGAAALDARALRAGLTVLRVFRPSVLVVRLGQADVASRDLYAYWEVLRRDDAELARLRAELAADPALAGTLLLVTADVGRDAAQNPLGGFGRADGSPDHRTVGFVAEGPGVRAGASPRGPRAARDLCPTLGRLLGVPTPHATGTARDDLFVLD